MFGLSKSEREVRKAQDEQFIEMSRQRCKAILDELKTVGPDDVERLNDVINGMLKNPRLPRDFRQKVRDRAKELSRDAMTRATDKALENATFFAKADKRREMRVWLGNARERMNKAGRYGATKEFKRAANMAIDAIRESGGVSSHGKPTMAKPKSKSEEQRTGK